jgi:hypothetical protein
MPATGRGQGEAPPGPAARKCSGPVMWAGMPPGRVEQRVLPTVGLSGKVPDSPSKPARYRRPASDAGTCFNRPVLPACVTSCRGRSDPQLLRAANTALSALRNGLPALARTDRATQIRVAVGICGYGRSCTRRDESHIRRSGVCEAFGPA